MLRSALSFRRIKSCTPFKYTPTITIQINSFSSIPESYTEKQAKLGRPVSPHVTIYKFPITAISSIANRATGIALSVGKCFFLLLYNVL